MGKRFNVFVSDEAYQIIKDFQKDTGSANLDNAIDQFILKHGNNHGKKV